MELPLCLADVIANYIVADGFTTWLMLLPIWQMVLPYVCIGWSRQML